MTQTLFDATARHLDQIAEILDQVLPSAELEKLREALAALGSSLGERYVISLNCLIEVFDEEKERTCPCSTWDSPPRTGRSLTGFRATRPRSATSWTAKSKSSPMTAALTAGKR